MRTAVRLWLLGYHASLRPLIAVSLHPHVPPRGFLISSARVGSRSPLPNTPCSELTAWRWPQLAEETARRRAARRAPCVKRLIKRDKNGKCTGGLPWNKKENYAAKTVILSTVSASQEKCQHEMCIRLPLGFRHANSMFSSREDTFILPPPLGRTRERPVAASSPNSRSEAAAAAATSSALRPPLSPKVAHRLSWRVCRRIDR